jgi:catechol 2,3-dioxygenase-like lactoylglutathione lyase family enzyme
MIDHIAIAVHDLQNSVKLYSDVFGFQLVEERTTTGEYSSMNSAVLVKNELILVLLESCGDSSSQISKFIENCGTGVQHMAIKVNSIEETLKKFSVDGDIAEFEIIEGEGIRQVFLKREIGTGVRIELVERNGGHFSDDTVNRLFRAFEKKDLY